MKSLIFFTCVALLPGCVSYKNPGPNGPPVFSQQDIQTRVAIRVGVRAPNKTDFLTVAEPSEREWRYTAALDEAKRLVRILSDCQLFESVVLTESGDTSCDVLLLALPRSVERTQLDDPWLLLYGGVIPSHSKNERGVCFRFLRGGTGDVIFKWTEEVVIGLWAPAVSSSSEKWESSRSSSTYWRDLRTEMLQVFSHTTKAGRRQE